MLINNKFETHRKKGTKNINIYSNATLLLLLPEAAAGYRLYNI